MPHVRADEALTRRLFDPASSSAAAARDTTPQSVTKRNLLIAVVLGVLIVTALGVGGYVYYSRASARQIGSIAVMPFVNDSGTADIEYLSDGLTETLIGSLSQLPNLNVKARSSVFRYKGKDVDAQTVAKDLNVQALLTGRVVQHGQDLV